MNENKQQDQTLQTIVEPTRQTVPQQKVSKPLIIAGSIVAMVVSLALLALLAWDNEPSPESVTSNAQVDPLAVIIALAIVFGITVLPGIIVALIVLPKLRKKR